LARTAIGLPSTVWTETTDISGSIGPAGSTRSALARGGFILTRSEVLPNGSGGIVPGFIFHRLLKTWLGSVHRTPSDLGRGEILDGPLDGIGDPLGEKLQVPGIRVALEDLGGCGGEWLCTLANIIASGRQTRPLVDEALGLVEDLSGDHAAVAEGNCEPVFTIVENQTTNPQLVMDLVAPPVVHTAGDRQTQRGGDVAPGRTGLELAVCICP